MLVGSQTIHGDGALRLRQHCFECSALTESGCVALAISAPRAKQGRQCAPCLPWSADVMNRGRQEGCLMSRSHLFHISLPTHYLCLLPGSAYTSSTRKVA